MIKRLFIIFWNGWKTTESTEVHREKKQCSSVLSVPCTPHGRSRHSTPQEVSVFCGKFSLP